MFFSGRKKEEQRRLVEAAALRAREAFDQQARIEQLVSLYGRSVDKNMPMTEAFKVIADCLEAGLPRAKKAKKN